MKPRWFLAGITIVLLFTRPFGLVVKADSYATVENLGSLGGDASARGVNAAGRTIGYGASADSTNRGFVADGASMTPINTLGGSESRAHGINDANVVVGFARLPDDTPRAVRYDPATDTLADLGSLGGEYSFAYAVNEAGTIVGYAQQASGMPVAFTWTEGAGLQPLGTLGGVASFGYGINDAGQVVGQSYTAGGQAHAFLYSGGVMQDLGTLGGSDSVAVAINNAGTVAGTASVMPGRSHAFRYSAGSGMQNLGTLGGSRSSGEAIASDGTVVGWSTTSAGRTHACLWTPAGDIIDLNTLVDPALGWELVAAYGINDNSQIVGQARIAGALRPFRLSPASNSDETAPVVNSIGATPSSLSPANHGMVAVDVTVAATDDSGEAPACQIVNVVSSEPDNGLGDGDTPDDVVLAGPLSVMLRAERSGTGTGRVYSIEVSCVDGAGNATTATAEVVVPKPAGGSSPASTKNKR
jgi:probable HAF family extracellular repeat protein